MSIGKIELEVAGITHEETLKLQEILTALVSSGAWRMKNGKAIIHFDSTGTFQGVQMDYWAWKRKSVDR